eukprot:5573915-Alexandrium_andersonii.AAC.1
MALYGGAAAPVSATGLKRVRAAIARVVDKKASANRSPYLAVNNVEGKRLDPCAISSSPERLLSGGR